MWLLNQLKADQQYVTSLCIQVKQLKSKNIEGYSYVTQNNLAPILENWSNFHSKQKQLYTI